MTRVDRRALFSSGAAAALLAATGVSLEAAPRTGGRLRLALPRDDDSLAYLARGAEFDTLTEIAPNDVLRGELATRWSADPEAVRWTFDLREDVRFHDGIPLQAQDVVASLQHRLNMAVHIEAEEALRVRIELDAACPGFPFLLAAQELIISRDQSVGTGCYRTERLFSGRHYLGRKIRNHYKTGHAGWVETIEAVVIPDATVRAEALRDGFVDAAALPEESVLSGMTDLRFLPARDNMVLAARKVVGVPAKIGSGLMDDGRLAERWWMS